MLIHLRKKKRKKKRNLGEENHRDISGVMRNKWRFQNNENGRCLFLQWRFTMTPVSHDNGFLLPVTLHKKGNLKKKKQVIFLVLKKYERDVKRYTRDLIMHVKTQFYLYLRKFFPFPPPPHSLHLSLFPFFSFSFYFFF